MIRRSIILFCLFAAIGCAGPPKPPTAADSVPVSHHATGATATYPTDIDGIILVIERALPYMEWNALNKKSDRTSLTMQALSPEDRTANISAELLDTKQSTVSVTIKLGNYGDADTESKFLQLLHAVRLDQLEKMK